MTTNRVCKLVKRPKPGLVTRDVFEFADEPMALPGPNQFRIKIEFISLDPAMRGWMNEGKSYVAPVPLGSVMRAYAAGHVDASNHPDFKVGDAVQGVIGVQQYALSDGKGIVKVDTSLAPLERWTGGLGMPGWTAYFGLLDICRPQRGETVVVSGAAGAVGMLVGQIAKIHGCRVVGVTRSEAKTAWLVDELGLDAAFNADDDATILDQRLEELCPDGIDVYFDTVGGALTDAVMHRLNSTARTCACGQISQGNLVAYVDRFEEGLEQLTRWLERGQIKYREEIARGLEAAPQAFIGMLLGKNEGKQLVQLSDR